MTKKASSSLIIFAKNPVVGKVKTRLAKDIGQERALEIYKQLLDHTHAITQPMEVHKCVYYSEYIEEGDVWELGSYKKLVQVGNGLGEKMHNAFLDQFSSGFHKVCIIGTDCFEIDEITLSEAFKALDTHDFVIGPANDGGYYLLGMCRPTPEIFRDKVYSTSHVFDEAMREIHEMGASVHVLTQLTDIDRVEDLHKMKG